MSFTFRALPGALSLALALALAPSAHAEFVPEGGTITTGTTVSEQDPVQLSFKVVRAGNVTITKRAASGTLSGGPEEDNSATPKFVGPTFEVRGDAVLAEAAFLIDDATVPPSFADRPRIANVGVRCLQENTQGGTAFQACGNAEGAAVAGSTTTPSGDIQAQWWIGQNEVSRGVQWDLARHGSAGGGDFNVDLSRKGFFGEGAFTSTNERHGLDGVLRAGGFGGSLVCNYACTLTGKITVSEKVRKYLGLSSRVIASGTSSPIKGGGRGRLAIKLLPLKAGVAAKLKAKRVAVLGATQASVVNGPDGETKKQRSFKLYLSTQKSRFSLNCRAVRGVSSMELTVFPRKGKTTCPNVGSDSDF